jgi:anti-sigma B factor antagonist
MANDPRPAQKRTLTIDPSAIADGVATLIFHGGIIAETSNLFTSQVKKLAAEVQYIEADLSDVDYVDSRGLGDVVAAYLSARSAGCHLSLINVHPRVKDLLNMTRLSSVLDPGHAQAGESRRG